MKTSDKFRPISVMDAHKYTQDYEVYIPQFIPVIEKYFNKEYGGSYYDHNIIPDLQKIDLFATWDYDTLKHYAFTTNSYLQELGDEARQEEFEQLMINTGFVSATPELLNYIATERQTTLYIVMMNGQNFLGGEFKKAKKVKLRGDNEKGFYWMAPNATRSGYKAINGQWIKPVH